MGKFERYLSVWVGLSILAGVLLGHLFPPVFQTVAHLEYAHVNLVGQFSAIINSKTVRGQRG